MTIKVTAGILQQALELPDADRALIAEQLIASLDPQIDQEVEIAWQQEVQRRLQQIDDHEVELVSWETVRDKLRKEQITRAAPGGN